MGRGFKLYSGRVIALGRLLLATLFMAAIGIDISQPALAPMETYALLVGYQLFAAVIAGLTWNNWWLDAKLAGPAHAVDVIMFTVLVYLTEGYTSPFFVFSIFVMLSAAIRWGWRETTLTAILIAILYLFAGLVAARSSMDFHFYRFIVRAGQLVIMSLILIWFGVHQWRARMPATAEKLLAEPGLEKSPLETGLRASMRALGATSGAILWREAGRAPVGLKASKGEASTVAVEDGQIASTPFLYDLKRNRALSHDAQRNLVTNEPAGMLGGNIATAFDLAEGLAVPVRTGTGEGQIFLQGMHLSTDHLDIGEQLAADLAGHIQRRELLEAAAESAAAQSRIALARDLHDSVVQFLAGAAFRLEAMRRSEGAGRRIEPELNELKQLMLQEQGELRAFITALRTGGRVAFADLARDLHSLADRLSRQWAIDCDFASESADVLMSTDVHLDAHQLVREAVANAVRHAGAKSVRVGLSATREAVRLEMVNDGAAYPKREGRIDLPKSLRERVELAGGAIDLSRGMGVTKLSISLPVEGRRA